MSNTNTNGRQERKTLASQLDRLDNTIDALADGLERWVADAVRQAVTVAVAEAVQAVLRELLARPELLRQFVPPAAPVSPAEPQPQQGFSPLRRAWMEVCTRLASVWVWLRSNAGGARGTLAERVRGYWQRVREAARKIWGLRWPVLLSLGIGLLAGGVGYVTGPVVSAVALGLCSAAMSLLAFLAAPLVRLWKSLQTQQA
jgi:hypothetical protein